ncbi:MAG: tRNA 2-thiocytidine(32) synthetase TtcA [Pseudobdellovibrionaceae bacterium]
MSSINLPNLDLKVAIDTRKKMVQAIADFEMLREGDKIMVAVSGGKDSAVLLTLFSDIQKRAPFHFSFEAVMLDQGHPGFNPKSFIEWVENQGIKFTLISKDTYSIVKEKVQNGVYCSLCSRLRRGLLYTHANKNGFTKIALGHHRDDLAETLLMNLFFTGKLATMPAKLRSDDESQILIRPLAYVAEKDIVEISESWQIPILPCNLCGSQDGMQRKKIKQLIRTLEKDIPEIGSSLLTAMGNVHASHLLDQKLWDFKSL